MIRFEREAAGGARRPLGHAGVGIAGDRFDYRIIDHVVSPPPRQGVELRSLRQGAAASPTVLRQLRPLGSAGADEVHGDLRELRDLVRSAVDPELMGRFAEMLESISAIRSTGRCRAPSTRCRAAERRFRLQGGRLEIRETVTRAGFEGWIAPELSRIDEPSTRPCKLPGPRPRDRPRFPHRRLLVRARGAPHLRGPLRRGQAGLDRPVRIDCVRACAHRPEPRHRQVGRSRGVNRCTCRVWAAGRLRLWLHPWRRIEHGAGVAEFYNNPHHEEGPDPLILTAALDEASALKFEGCGARTIPPS